MEERSYHMFLLFYVHDSYVLLGENCQRKNTWIAREFAEIHRHAAQLAAFWHRIWPMRPIASADMAPSLPTTFAFCIVSSISCASTGSCSLPHAARQHRHRAPLVRFDVKTRSAEQLVLLAKNYYSKAVVFGNCLHFDGFRKTHAQLWWFYAIYSLCDVQTTVFEF